MHSVEIDNPYSCASIFYPDKDITIKIARIGLGSINSCMEKISSCR